MYAPVVSFCTLEEINIALTFQGDSVMACDPKRRIHVFLMVQPGP